MAKHVHLLGFVDEATKHHELASAWVALAPSAKEGWGLNVVDAASHGVPTVAHHGAGGLSESIVDGVTGLLVDDLDPAGCGGVGGPAARGDIHLGWHGGRMGGAARARRGGRTHRGVE